MGLKDAPQSVMRIVAGCLDRCLDFRGMMRIIVHNGCPVSRFSLDFKSSVGTMVKGQGIFDSVRRDVHDICCGNGSQSVIDIVPARHFQSEGFEYLSVFYGHEACTALLIIGNLLCGPVGRMIDSIGNGMTVCLIHQLGHQGIISTADDITRLRDECGIFDKRIVNLIDIPEIIEMIPVNVQNHCHIRMKFQETVHIFAGLGNKVFAVAGPYIPAYFIQFPSDQDGGIQAGLVHDHGQHGGRCCFSMGAGYTDGKWIRFHDLPQQGCPVHTGDAPFFCFFQLRIIFMDCCSIYNQIGAFDIFAVMALENSNAVVGKALGKGRQPKIRSGHMAAFLMQYFCQSAHADSANADKMYMFS